MVIILIVSNYGCTMERNWFINTIKKLSNLFQPEGASKNTYKSIEIKTKWLTYAN